MKNTAAPNTNPLSAETLSNIILSSLPLCDASGASGGGGSSSTSSSLEAALVKLKSSTDAIAIACHAGMISVDFRLVGLGEEGEDGERGNIIQTSSEKSAPRPLPVQWRTQGQHAFRYKHMQSSMEYLLKVSRLGNKTVVYGIGIGDDKTTSFDVLTRDYISEAALPLSLSLRADGNMRAVGNIRPDGDTSADAVDAKSSDPQAQSQSQQTAPNNRHQQQLQEEREDKLHAIQSVFISPSRLTDLGSLLKINIIQKLVPSLQKEGYQDTSSSTTANTSSSTSQRAPPSMSPLPHDPDPSDPLRNDPLLPSPARPHPLADPSIGPPPPRRPIADFPPPDFEDEYELQRPYPRAGGGGRPQGGPPIGIGERDLYPPGLGPNDPLRIGGIGVGPYAGGRGGSGGGGMHPTFDDPIFRGGRGPGRGGSMGGYDPQVPPGARYDDPLGQDGGGNERLMHGSFGFGGAGAGNRSGRGRGGGGGFGFGGAAPHNPFGGFGSGDFI